MFGYPVLIGINLDDFFSFNPSFVCFFFSIEKIYQALVSSAIQTFEFVKNNLLRVVFSTPFSLFGYSDKTLSLLFDTCIVLESIEDGCDPGWRVTRFEVKCL